MKVLNIAWDDYANLSYNNALALQAVGIDCTSIKRRKHSFGYENESPIGSTMQIKEAAREADIIQVFHSWDFLLDDAFKDKKKVIWHTGTTYRQNHEKLNHVFNSFVDMTITDQCEFMHLGAKNIHYMATAIDTDKIKPIEREITKPYKVGHYPSNPEVKGSAKIIEMMQEVQRLYPGVFVFDCDYRILPHEQNLKRIAQCDIYIELFAPLQNGKEYGCFGVTAFEAAAMGLFVITQNSYPDVYEKAYGITPFFCCNTQERFMLQFELIAKNLNSEKEMKNLRWAVTFMRKRHDHRYTGTRMKMLLESIL